MFTKPVKPTTKDLRLRYTFFDPFDPFDPFDRLRDRRDRSSGTVPTPGHHLPSIIRTRKGKKSHIRAAPSLSFLFTNWIKCFGCIRVIFPTHLEHRNFHAFAPDNLEKQNLPCLFACHRIVGFLQPSKTRNQTHLLCPLRHA